MTTDARPRCKPCCLGALLFVVPMVCQGGYEAPGNIQFTGLVEAQLPFSDGEDSWLRRGPGKFRYDDGDSGELKANQVGLDLRYSFNLQSEARLAAHYYGGPDSTVELTEAYWQYRTLNSDTWRSRYRVGAFYPGFSLENHGRLWTSPYTLSSSFINTWIGEEIRTIGIEGKWTWSDKEDGVNRQQFSILAALYGFNDPMGAMISWRGWAGHDRQNGVNGTLPVRELPIIQPKPGRPVLSDNYEPFMEIDDRPGYYAGVEWELPGTLKAQAVFYDNLADDDQFEDGQYGWRTWFYQVAAHWRLPGDIEVLSQFLSGNTVMKTDVVDNDFESAYLMLVKTLGPHRFALRWEYGEVVDLDDRSFDYNEEEGDAWTVAYSYLTPENWKFSVEGTRRYSDQQSRVYFDEQTDFTEYQLLLSARYYFQAW